MTITTIIMSAVALLFSAAALVYCVKLTLVYHRFNEQIKDWARSLDDSMQQALWLASRRLLRELDDKITENNNNQENTENTNEELDACEPLSEDE